MAGHHLGVEALIGLYKIKDGHRNVQVSTLLRRTRAWCKSNTETITWLLFFLFQNFFKVSQFDPTKHLVWPAHWNFLLWINGAIRKKVTCSPFQQGAYP